jgi:predicted transposase YbfD/YdcC
VIRAAKCDFVIAVKENQPTLLADIQRHIAENAPCDIDYTLEKSKGRREKRACFVYDNFRPTDPEWGEIARVIRIRRGRNEARASAFFITSAAKSAAEFNAGIRAHWNIENKLHWVKDVVFQEDAIKSTAGNQPVILSMLTTWTMTVLQLNGFKAIQSALRIFANDLVNICRVLE